MEIAYLLLGGNLGNRKENLAEARRLIEGNCGTISQQSSLYETAAWGKTDQPAFLNQALEVQTKLTAHKLLSQLLKIEKEIGRVRKEKYGPRLIDIDVLLYNNEILKESALTIPHPELQNRRFALGPLSEIAANYIHPIFKKTISQLLILCPDKLLITKL